MDSKTVLAYSTAAVACVQEDYLYQYGCPVYQCGGLVYQCGGIHDDCVLT